MKISAQGLALIKEYEGFSAVPYLCPAGRKTVGYGHVICPGEEYDGGISQDKAEILLIQDVTKTAQAVNCLVKVAINQSQFDALVSFSYNIGTQTFEKSTLLRILNAENPGVAAQFARWVYING